MTSSRPKAAITATQSESTRATPGTVCTVVATPPAAATRTVVSNATAPTAAAPPSARSRLLPVVDEGACDGIERVACGAQHAPAAVRRAQDARGDRRGTAGQGGHVSTDLVTGYGNAGHRRVQDLLLERWIARQQVPEPGDEQQQRRQQRQEPVVG